MNIALCALAVSMILASPPPRDLSPAPIFTEADEHHFLVTPGGSVAVSLSRSPRARLVFAFPSGNSGVGLWLAGPPPGRVFRLEGPPVMGPAAAGARQTVGVKLRTDASELRFQTLGGSVRFLRTFDREGDTDPRDEVREVLERMRSTDPATLREVIRAGFRPAHLQAWLEPALEVASRRRTVTWGALAGGVAHRLTIEVEEGGTIEGSDAASPVVKPGSRGLVKLTADTCHAPLSPFAAAELFDRRIWPKLAALAETQPARARWVEEGLGRLRFLCYKEKFLAGSWRYLTYFGRDTLLTARMLRPILSVDAIEAALSSVVQRLGPDGQVAHEESLGDQAVLDRVRSLLDHAATEPGAPDATLLDYKMVDGEFILPITLSEYASDPRVTRERARAFVRSRAGRIAANLDHVVRSALAFARSERAVDLVSLGQGLLVGDWRDSEDGLAGGRYPYSINAVLVPQALDAIERLAASGLVPQGPDVSTPSLSAALAHGRSGLSRIREKWGKAHELFTIRRTPDQVREQTAAYLEKGPLTQAESSLAPRPGSPASGMCFPAVSLDAGGDPIPVMCSDGVLALFGQPLDDQRLAETLEALETPFPAGLWHPAGLLVANPALSGSPDLWKRFARRHYHGTVIWSWPIAMAEMGLARQLAVDRPEPLAARARTARATIRAFLERNAQRGLAELWSFGLRGQRFEPNPFGESDDDVTESNALQLWSASWLASAIGPLD